MKTVKTISISLRPITIEIAKKIAKKQGRSVSQTIAILIHEKDSLEMNTTETKLNKQGDDNEHSKNSLE